MQGRIRAVARIVADTLEAPLGAVHVIVDEVEPNRFDADDDLGVQSGHVAEMITPVGGGRVAHVPFVRGIGAIQPVAGSAVLSGVPGTGGLVGEDEPQCLDHDVTSFPGLVLSADRAYGVRRRVNGLGIAALVTIGRVSPPPMTRSEVFSVRAAAAAVTRSWATAAPAQVKGPELKGT